MLTCWLVRFFEASAIRIFYDYAASLWDPCPTKAQTVGLQEGDARLDISLRYPWTVA